MKHFEYRGPRADSHKIAEAADRAAQGWFWITISPGRRGLVHADIDCRHGCRPGRHRHTATPKQREEQAEAIARHHRRTVEIAELNRIASL